MDASFEYRFPAIRGVQARREYYVSMCPLRLIPKIFSFDSEELPPEYRAQRTLNESRVPDIARYISENPDSYVFSALTASIDAPVHFESHTDNDESRLGVLKVPMDARFIINDGQHRRAAIEAALEANPALGYETIAVVFFQDNGLERCQQMFADLNRHAIRPSPSIGVLYDHRDAIAALTREMVFSSSFFKDVVEMERSTLSSRSRKLFTLSALYYATRELVRGWEGMEVPEAIKKTRLFWEAVAEHIPEWNEVHKRNMSAGEVRRDFLHSHAVMLQALGRVGNALLSHKDWRKRLDGLDEINWARSHSKTWEGRATIGGKVNKSRVNVTLTSNLLKQSLGLPLSESEAQIEDNFKKRVTQ